MAYVYEKTYIFNQVEQFIFLLIKLESITIIQNYYVEISSL